MPQPAGWAEPGQSRFLPLALRLFTRRKSRPKAERPIKVMRGAAESKAVG
jgi:hypothetical protein